MTMPALAAEGITPDSVTLMQTADVSGSRAPLGREVGAGLRAYLAQVNAEGGVHGRRVLLTTEDDGYDVERTRSLIRDHLKRDDVFGFVSLIGTANAAAALPLINEANAPLLAPLSGAAQLREPFSRNVFHIRASYAKEVEKMVEHVRTLGIERVAVFYDDDAFGQDVLLAADQALTRRQMRPVARGRVERGSTDVAAAVKAIAAAQAQVVICGSFGPSLIALVKAMKATGQHPTFYALSFFTAGSSITQLGDDARGIAVTQVMPNPNSVGIPLVRDFQRAMRAYQPGAPMTAITLEGYVTARVAVEGLRRAGPKLTRAAFIDALQTLRDVDLGALRLSYSAKDHAGLNFVEISVVGPTGTVIH